MIYGVIDEKSKSRYTFFKDVFTAINNLQINYNWLITDSEIIANSDELIALNTNVYWKHENGKPVVVPAPEYHFLSGNELTKIVARDNSQWIWGVLSGFNKSIRKEEILRYPLPTANGNKGFWKNPPSMQHPLAAIEIVPFDSSLILFFCKDKELVDLFRTEFPACEDLSAYNSQS